MLSFADPKEIQLRPYQADAIDALRDGIREGRKKQILCATTGAGKTVCAAHLLKEASQRGVYSIFMVDRVALVNQTSATLDQYGIRHGVIQGMNDRFAPNEHVQVASVQTLARRFLPRLPGLLIYDECHSIYESTIEFIGRNPNAVVVGLTATPFTKGMGKHWDGVVNVIPTRSLIDSGHLVEPTIFVARSPEDSELALKSNGEFSGESATTAGIQIIGDVIKEWERKVFEHFGGPAKTIVFSPTVEHGRELCAAFAAVGYNFQQVSYLDRDDAERAEKIAEFRRPDSVIHGLVSCGVLTKGFDVPDVMVGVSCKPYRKSLSSHMQEIGRIMRPYPGKDKALWLCHSGNVERFALETYSVWQNGVGELDQAERRDSTPRERDPETREKVVCPECSGALRGNSCTACGWERPARSGVHAVDGELQEFSLSDQLKPRDGLRAECLKDPRAVWDAALSYTSQHSRRGEDHARKWAYGVWRGIYPDSKLPGGWFNSKIPGGADIYAFSLIEREVKRFRKGGRA